MGGSGVGTPRRARAEGARQRIFQPDRRGESPAVRWSSAADRGVVLVDDVLLDASAIGNLVSGALRPFPDRAVLVAVAARGAAAPPRSGARPDGRASPHLGARGNVGLQGGAQFLGVLLGQVDRILHTVEPERHTLIGGLTVQIVDQFLNDTLGHAADLP